MPQTRTACDALKVKNEPTCPAAYIYDPDRRAEHNRRGRNYWYEYVKEILAQMGVGAMPVSIDGVENGSGLDGIRVLIAGDLEMTS